ncbi:MAG: glycosyltransferase family 4 protein [Caulobacteraceae bacterium]|nr:glycosyltransferase family 4 protein [Caulobacteraceae bacterium]
MSLNILVVARSLPVHASGGMESAAWDLARRFAKLGHKTTILTTSHPDLPEHSEVDGVSIHTVAAPPGRYSKAWWTGSAAVFAARYAGTTDVVLGVSAAANALVGVRDPARAQAFVFQAHGTSSGEIVSKLRQRTPKAYVGLLKNLYWLVFKDRIYRRFDAVVAIGDAVERQFHTWPTRLLIGATPSVMISNGVDAEQFQFDPLARARFRDQMGLAPDARVILSLSRLHAQKGLLVGLSAFRRALGVDPKLRYLIAGAGPYQAELESLIANWGLEGKAIMLGGVPRAEVPAHLSAADVFLFPTLRVEGLPITLLEALASGLAVITTPNGGDKELPCVRVPVADVEATTAAILDVTKTSSERASALPERYSLDYSGRQYVALFEKLLHRTPSKTFHNAARE